MFQISPFEMWFYKSEHFFMILYMYIAPRAGADTPREQNVDVKWDV